MKFNVENAPKPPRDDGLIGNVYRCKGGRGYLNKFWVVVGQNGNTVICLGINEMGEIISSANYGAHVFLGYCYSREPVGRVTEMPNLDFTIEWFNFD